LAFTITTVGASATAVGTNANDSAFFGGLQTLNLTGFEGDDAITITSLAGGLIEMNEGNDFVFGGGFDLVNTTIKGGEGADFLTADSLFTGASIRGGKGDDFIAVFDVDNATVKGGKGNDFITLSGFDVQNFGTVGGGKGDDIILGDDIFTGSSVTGGEGNDTITFSFNSTFSAGVFGGAGDDSIVLTNLSSGGNVYGDDGNDFISATGTIFAGAGDDEMDVLSRFSSYWGGTGADEFNVSATSATFFAGTIRDYEAGIDVIDLANDYPFASVNGNTNINYQADGLINNNTTVYEISTALTAGTFLATYLSNAGQLFNAFLTTTNVALEYVWYQGGDAIVSLAQVDIFNGFVTRVDGVTNNVILQGVAAGSLSAADFV
jgi:hypothetical protein